MEIARFSVFGNSNVGAYIFANNKVCLVPPSIPKDDRDLVQEILKAEVVEAKISGTNLNGVFVVGNDNGIALPYIVYREELEELEKAFKELDLRVVVVHSPITALGNAVAVNNKAGIVSPEVPKKDVEILQEVLGVELVRTAVAGLSIPGSLIVVNDTGGVVYPRVSDDELKELEGILKVRLGRATVNAGVPFIRSGLVANNSGALVGGATTGPEILRVKKGLEGGGE